MPNPRTLFVASMIGSFAAIAMGQVTPVRSSITSDSFIYLTVVDENDESIVTDSQLDTLLPLGPANASAGINSSQGTFSGSTNTSASFSSSSAGQFISSMQHQGNQGPGKIEAQSFGHTHNGQFIYEFTIPSDGTLNLDGVLTNFGISFISFNVSLQLQAENTIGGGFAGFIYQESVLDEMFDNIEIFDRSIPLNRPSGSYRLIIELRHSGLGQLDQSLEQGSLDINFDIQTTNPCPADINIDGVLDFFDVSAFLTAFGNQDPAADFNGDLTFDFFDVSAFLTEFSMGCP